MIRRRFLGVLAALALGFAIPYRPRNKFTEEDVRRLSEKIYRHYEKLFHDDIMKAVMEHNYGFGPGLAIAVQWDPDVSVKLVETDHGS
jgi:hypothetical protein